MSDTLDQVEFERLRALLTEAYTNKKEANKRFRILLNYLTLLVNVRAVSSMDTSCDSCKHRCHLRVKYQSNSKKFVCGYHSQKEKEMSGTLNQVEFEKLRSMLTEAYIAKKEANRRFKALLNELYLLANVRNVIHRDTSCDSCKYACHLRVKYNNRVIAYRNGEKLRQNVVCDYHCPKEK